MTTFNELLALTYEATKRPELVSITQAAVRMAVLRAHGVDNWRRDKVIHSYTYATNSANLFVDIANISSVLTRYRQIAFVQAMDPTTLYPTENLGWRDYKDFWEEDNATGSRVLRDSCYDIIGETLRLRFASQTGRCDIHYYQLPNTAADPAFSSWIANNHPDEIAQWAAGIVYARTGFLEQAKVQQDQHITPFKDFLVSTYLRAAV